MTLKTTSGEIEQSLRRLVALHTVRYEVYFEQGKVGDELCRNGI
jgi:hypothetical protein